MNDTIQPISIETDVSVKSSADQERKSYSEPEQGMLFSCGDDSLTARDRQELIALFSATRDHAEALTLSDRLTPSLISAGLVCGITPTSTREKCGAPIPAFVLLLPDGRSVAQPKMD